MLTEKEVREIKNLIENCLNDPFGYTKRLLETLEKAIEVIEYSSGVYDKNILIVKCKNINFIKAYKGDEG